MERPAGVAGGRRGLRLAHALVRMLLVGALVVLLVLIAMHELRAPSGVAVPGVTGTSAPAVVLRG